ncbi:MAG TPA: outer membrane lipoprotein carrier protein LolA [Flavobacteriaceae bacterium]|nr:outer membrane lipoprotein carrier protein LolA [Flavobacteriaceae bacterium]
MKKNGIILICLVCFGFSSWAQSHLQPKNSAKTEEAKNLMETVASKVRSYDNMEIEFEYTFRDPSADINQETRGTVSLKGDKYRMDLMGIIRIFDGEKIYTIVPEDEEVTISSYDAANDQGLSPSQMLLFYEKGYNYKMDIVQNVLGRTIQYVKLTPVDKNSEIKQILLGIDRQTKHIYNLIQNMKDGSQITIEINSFKTNQPISDLLFTFREEKYKDYYINRLD